jgi:hypothetical protein
MTLSWTCVAHKPEQEPWPHPRRGVLKLDIRLQGIVQPCREDIDLVLLCQPIVAGEKGQELALKLCHHALVAELDQFTKYITP